jgi:hypothetical protein
MKKSTFEKQLKRGAMVEKREHPWASLATAARIAGDHIKEGKRYRYWRRD